MINPRDLTSIAHAVKGKGNLEMADEICRTHPPASPNSNLCGLLIPPLAHVACVRGDSRHTHHLPTLWQRRRKSKVAGEGPRKQLLEASSSEFVDGDGWSKNEVRWWSEHNRTLISGKQKQEERGKHTGFELEGFSQWRARHYGHEGQLGFEVISW